MGRNLNSATGRAAVLGMLARIWRKGPDAADGSGYGAEGAKTPAAG